MIPGCLKNCKFVYIDPLATVTLIIEIDFSI